MSHENENPQIIDVVGEAESADESGANVSAKGGKGNAKKGFFRKAAAGRAAAQAATAEEVSAAKRAEAEATVPRVEEAPSQQAPVNAAPQSAFSPQSQPQASQQASPQPEPVVIAQPATAEPSWQAQPVPPAQQPVVQAPVQPQPQPQPQAQPAVIPQPLSAPQAPAPTFQGAAVASVAAPRRNAAVYVLGILAALVVVFAIAAAGFYSLIHLQGGTDLALTGSTESVEESESGPIASAAFDQASKVSLRATAEGWSEEASTPLVAYIKRVDDVESSSSSTAQDSDDNQAEPSESYERYFAFAPNKNASVSLPSGRYTFSFITPLNADRSLYAVPDMVDMVVGDGGTAVLPVDLSLIEADAVTEEQASHALAQLKTAWETQDASFDHEPFAKAVDLALNSWFAEQPATEGQPTAELTADQQASLDAQAESQTGDGSASASDSAVAAHDHQWTALTEQRWEPAVVPVIDMVAWESPVYASYACAEGVLFETLDECLAHVRARGNESYTTSNAIMRIDYHPAVVHYEERGSYVSVITGYRCSVCGATGSL